MTREMTEEEAIKHIENIIPYVGENTKESLNMAIKALEIKRNTSQKSKGKWIISEDKSTACCPFCYTKVKDKDEVRLLGTAFSGLRFCQYCGAENK